MSKERELLMRALPELDHKYNRDLIDEIETYLAEPAQEPKPVAWRDNITGNFSHQKTDHSTPLYSTPPDAAKRIAELEGQLEAVISTRNAEAKAIKSYDNARENFSQDGYEYHAMVNAMQKASDAEKLAKQAIAKAKG